MDERTAKKIWYLAQEISLISGMDIDDAVTCAWWEIERRLDYVKKSLKGTIPEKRVARIYARVAAKILEHHDIDILNVGKQNRCMPKRLLAHILANEYAVSVLCVARITKYNYSSLYTYDMYETIRAPKALSSYEASVKWWYVQIKQYIEEAIEEVKDELSTTKNIC